MATFNLQNSEGNIIQTNIGDSRGNLWASRNIDLTPNPGKLKLSRPFKIDPISTSPENEFADAVQALAIMNTNLASSGAQPRLFALNRGGSLYSRPLAGATAVTVQTITGATYAQDMAVYNGGLAIVYDTDIAFMNNSHSIEEDWWTDEGGTALDDDFPHILQVHRSGKETISVTDGSFLRYYNTDAGPANLELPTGVVACCQASGLGRGWVGTYTTSSDEALVVEWSIGNDEFTRAYPTGAKAVLAMEVVDDVPYIITERGEIKVFNNVGFTTVATLPIYYQPTFFTGVGVAGIDDFSTSRPIHPKGMRRFHDSLLIYINADLNATAGLDSRTASGIWEFNIATRSLSLRHVIDGDIIQGASSPLLISNEASGRIWCTGTKLTPNSENEFNGVWSEDLSDDTATTGWFVSPEMSSSSITDAFTSVVTKAKLQDNQSIVLKYRTEIEPITRVLGNWLSNTTFNTTSNMSAVMARFQAGQKDEATIALGTNSGLLAHIENIEQSTTVYSVTLDEAIGTTGEDVWLDFENWTKIKEDYTSGSFKKQGIDVVVPKIQIKTYLSGYNGFPEIYGQTQDSTNKEKQ